ncbi:MAG TPA: GFA family protein [Kofleriaceae bacterium]|nr:GFA family protein [Kofleriaceae bacterium]
MTTEPKIQKHTGGCHCGAVRFEVELDASAGTMCNCTICAKTAMLGGMAKPAQFTLLAGEADLLSYEWGSKSGQRKFCKHCGIQCFAPGYLEQLGGAYVSINLRCLDGFDLGKVKIGHWDGRHNNWQAGMRAEPWPVEPAAQA